MKRYWPFLISIVLIVLIPFVAPELGVNALLADEPVSAIASDFNGDASLSPGTGELISGNAENGNSSIVPTPLGKTFSIMTILRGLLGMFVLIGLAWLFSNNRKAISWKVVLIGLSIQLLLAIGVLQVPFVQAFFEFIGKIFVKILEFTNAGTEFLFASFITGQLEMPLINFAITILPTIIFFSALSSVLFYLGIIQKVVFGLAWGMT